MLSEAEISQARDVTWHLRAEAISLLKSTAIWESGQGVLPSTRGDLPYGLGAIKSHIRLACMRDVIMGLWRLSDPKKDFVSLYRLQKTINALSNEDPQLIAKNLWSVGLHQATAKPSDIPSAISFLKLRMGPARGYPPTLGNYRSDLNEIRNGILAHAKLNTESKFLVKRRRAATVLVAELVRSTLIVFDGFDWNCKRFFRNALKQANLFWNVIHQQSQIAVSGTD
ncbi:MAG: hypothetical protein WA384_12820 [Rhodomicrobium sp.]